MNTPQQFAIVGAGLAGVSAAKTLRPLGYDGRIFLISDESNLPYDRPPLRKLADGNTRSMRYSPESR